MRSPKTPPSSVEVFFETTPDGLVLNQIVLHPANTAAERDLRSFLARFRDPELDLNARVRFEV